MSSLRALTTRQLLSSNLSPIYDSITLRSQVVLQCIQSKSLVERKHAVTSSTNGSLIKQADELETISSFAASVSLFVRRDAVFSFDQSIFRACTVPAMSQNETLQLVVEFSRPSFSAKEVIIVDEY